MLTGPAPPRCDIAEGVLPRDDPDECGRIGRGTPLDHLYVFQLIAPPDSFQNNQTGFCLLPFPKSDGCLTRLSDFYRRRIPPSPKTPCAEVSAGFAQGRSAEISAHTGLFTNNCLIVVSLRVARKERQKPPATTLSTPCLEKSPKV